MADKKSVNLTIYGKVQGVWYRAMAKKKATELGVFGFVANEEDGSVYAEIEGDQATLDKIIAWCQEGPPLAKVNKIDVKYQDYKGFTSFEIYDNNFRA